MEGQQVDDATFAVDGERDFRSDQPAAVARECPCHVLGQERVLEREHPVERPTSPSGDHLNATMDALGGKVQSETLYLLIAGAVMVVTLWLSKKARTVTETEISLGQQDVGQERFGSSPVV